jgi:hypothetical protein
MFILNFLLFVSCIFSTEIEDKLETEIDERLPSTFHSHITLSVRMDGFSIMTRIENNQTVSWNIGNWERFAWG